MSAPQQRCVFVGNIPYDATEEQLVEICKEVGPVVSFRLVLDRETGKPKGYGFCEYRDEETAASARRNLQGYDVNGRQLRVDYAENAKGVDRNREQDRGGPGLASNFDNQKQPYGAAFSVDPSVSHPVGLSLAARAASIMAEALGGPQTAITSQGQTNAGGHDPLTLHLASMSKNQLYEVLHEMKALAQQNQKQAHQILVTYPQFSKALFQIEIMLEMVPSHMLPNFRQSSNMASQQAIQTGQSDAGIQAGQQGQTHSGQNQIQPGQQTQMQVGQNGQSQLLQQTQSIPMQQLMQTPPVQPPIQNLQQSQTQVSQPILQSIQPVSENLHLPAQPPMQPPQNALIQPQAPPIHSGQSRQPSIQPSLGNLHQPPLPQQPRPSLQSHQPPGQVQSQQTQSMAFKPSSSLHQQPSRPTFQPGIPYQKHAQPPLPNLPPPQQSYQVGSGSAALTVTHAGSDAVGQGTGQSNLPTSAGLLILGAGGAVQGGRGHNLVQYLNNMGPDGPWAQVPLSAGGSHYPAAPSGTGEPAGAAGDLATGLPTAVPSTTEDGSNRTYAAASGEAGGMVAGSSENVVGASPPYSQGPRQTPVEVMLQPQQPMPQLPQLSPEIESALLQQVMNLTPEQINSLPPDQQQEVLQLQQMIRNK
uniref:RRM domain-containing protein n=1 Tax=Araucaria cunninghamii TaxID=56994 RepID=A0A0D6QZN8_ARACU